jgi:hypothetical protein
MQGDTIDQAAIPDSSVTPSKISGSNFAFSGDLRLKDADGSHYVGFASPTTVTTNKVWTLPAADGTSGQFLKTNGSAVLSWDTVDTSTLMPLSGGIFSGDVTFDGATAGYDIVWDKSDNALEWADNAKAKFGTGGDLEIFHNASNSVINDAGTGDLLLQVGGSTKATVSSTGFDITGALTVSTNATITGNLTVSGTTTTINTQTLDVEDKNVVIGKVSSPSDTTADGGGWTLKGASDKTFNWVNATDAWTSSEHIHLGDNKKFLAGTGSDLSIYHDGTDSIISNATNVLKTHSSHLFIRNAAGNEDIAKFIQDGAVELYHNNAKKIETTSGGINVTGAINVNGSALATAPTIELTANGSITANAGVIVNPSGQVEGLSGAVASTGSIVQWESGTAPQQTSCKLADGKYIICYSDVNNSEHGTAVLVTTSGTTVTAHSGAVFSANQTLHISCCRVSDTQFAILYYDDTNNYFKVRLGTVSGTSISYGSELNTSKGGTPGTLTNAIGYQSNVGGLLIVLATSNTGSTWPVYTMAHISGTSIVFSNAGWGTVRSSTGHDFNIVENTTDNELLFTWISTPDQNGGRSRTAKLAGSTNHTVTWGQDEYISNQNQYYSKVCYNADDNVYAYVFRNADQSNKLSQCCGTPSGSGSSRSISWTSYANFYTSAGHYPAIAYSSTASRYVIIYADSGNTGSMILYKQSGTSIISDGSSVVTYQAGANVAARSYQSVVDIGGGKFGITFPYGTSGGRTFARQLSTTNLTAFNFLGFSSAAYTNGQTATINVVGNTISGQSSLTPGAAYFVSGDGSLSTTEGVPSVKAGVALSSTKILIRQ